MVLTMDHWIDKELTGYLHSKSCSQYVKVMSGVPQRSILGQGLFSISQQHGIEGTMSTFTIDTKLCGTLNTLEGRNAIQKGL